MPDQIDVNVHFDPPPPKKRHPFWSCLAVIFAAMLIGGASGSGLVFALVAGIGIILVILESARPAESNGSQNPDGPST